MSLAVIGFAYPSCHLLNGEPALSVRPPDKSNGGRHPGTGQQCLARHYLSWLCSLRSCTTRNDFSIAWYPGASRCFSSSGHHSITVKVFPPALNTNSLMLVGTKPSAFPLRTIPLPLY